MTDIAATIGELLAQVHELRARAKSARQLIENIHDSEARRGLARFAQETEAKITKLEAEMAALRAEVGGPRESS